MNKAQVKQDIVQTTIFKGIAICAVLALHTLSSIHGMYSQVNTLSWLLVVDQLLRFCVPMFVALSGYALAKKYGAQFSFTDFMKRRVVKLVPQYLLWSFIFIIPLALLYPNWGNPLSYLPLWKVILLGKADYHLYFVSTIVQLYLLFPILRVLMRRNPTLAVLSLIGIQVATYLIISPLMAGKHIPYESLLDQNQYAISLNWIGYFGIGMWIANAHVSILKRLTPVFVVCTVLGAIFSVLNALSSMQLHVDPVIALRTTRMAIYLMASGVIGLMITYRRYTSFLGKHVGALFVWLGTYSYTIYLSHTILFRIIFSVKYGEQSLVGVIPATLLFIAGVIASKYL